MTEAAPAVETAVLEIEAPKPEQAYKPVLHHWFHCRDIEDKAVWTPFSQIDSDKLEAVYNSDKSGVDTLIATDGGRYDVSLPRRERISVYWKDNTECVRRCSWFYKGTSDARYVPYPEDVADTLEEEFRLGVITSVWNRKVALPSGESVVLHSAAVMVHFLKQASPDAWGSTPPFFAPPTQRTVARGTAEAWPHVEEGEDDRTPDHLLFIVHGIGEPKKMLKKQTEEDEGVARARSVRRGPDTTQVEEGETAQSDHLLFLIHGIGSACDLKFRTLEEVVDDFRSISRQLVQSHYKTSCDKGQVNRIEVLPVSWHWNLHSEETGIDKRINTITLESVPKLRGFTNDTLLDILFYTSPKFCQTIMSTVGDEINRIYTLFRQRNPAFQGGVSVGGHSLGSVIMFDLLCHQKPPGSRARGDAKPTELSENQGQPLQRQLSYVMGAAGTGQPSITYPQLLFQPKAFFAMGSPIGYAEYPHKTGGMFVCVRGLEDLGENFTLPTCPAFFNIFHPFDPVAYRIESLINPDLSKVPPMQIPHHKGRKRMHLELKDTVFRVGSDLKQKVMESMKSTWDSFTQMAAFSSPREAAFGERVKEVIEEELIKEVTAERTAEEVGSPGGYSADPSSEVEQGLAEKLGKLNAGRRVDWVLQEAPFELFNEYIFAMASHVCYWESSDTMLLILKEIYSSMGMEPDRQTSQPTMTIERTVLQKTSGASSGDASSPRQSLPELNELSEEPTTSARTPE